MTLGTEVRRLNRSLDYMFRQGGGNSLSAEVPLRIHTRDTDAGHGLGGPAFSPEFERWLSSICMCGRPGDPKALSPDDQRGCPVPHFRASDNHARPQRLKRALSKLRQVAPAEFDALNLMIVHHLTWDEARTKINDGRERRGQKPYSIMDFLVLTIAGTDKLATCY